MATPTAETFILHAFLGRGSATDPIAVFEKSSTSLSGFRIATITKEFATSATDQSVNLADFVDTATLIAIEDTNNTGVLVGRTTGTSARLQVAANGFLLYHNGNATPPTLYFDNVSGTEKAFIKIYILGTSA